MRVDQPCPNCQSTDHLDFITGFDRTRALEENFRYVKCNDCALVFMCPLPDTATIKSYYEDGYDPYAPADTNNIDARHSKRFNRFLIRHHYAANAPETGRLSRAVASVLSGLGMGDALSPRGQSRLLDVGCGNGSWLYRHRVLGWNVTGVEPSLDVAERCRQIGLKVYTGTLFDVPETSRYDVIAFRHVLEHVPDPVGNLARARSLLADGGRILVLAPNLDSHGFKRYREFWMPLDPPRHLMQFSRATIARVGQRAGLRVVRARTQAQAHLLAFSHRYALSFDREVINDTRLEFREEAVRRVERDRRKFARRDSFYKKLVRPLTWFHALVGKGETMSVLFAHGSISGARAGDSRGP